MDYDLDGDLDLISSGYVFRNNLNPTTKNYLRYAGFGFDSTQVHLRARNVELE